jgi:hypothetical protein
MKDKRSVLGASKERLFQAKDAADREEERDSSPVGRLWREQIEARIGRAKQTKNL